MNTNSEHQRSAEQKGGYMNNLNSMLLEMDKFHIYFIA
jgi:hypothetical protein